MSTDHPAPEVDMMMFSVPTAHVRRLIWEREGRARTRLRRDLVRVVPDSLYGAIWPALGGLNDPDFRDARQGLLEGSADNLNCLLMRADHLEESARAIRDLVAHVEATHPLAQRRQTTAPSAERRAGRTPGGRGWCWPDNPRPREWDNHLDAVS